MEPIMKHKTKIWQKHDNQNLNLITHLKWGINCKPEMTLPIVVDERLANTNIS
jgi:hypothetical protein